MKKILFTIVTLTVTLFAATGMSAQVCVSGLTAEHLTNPIGIDTNAPRLGWRITSSEKNVMQTAYHILVASTPELLTEDNGDIWDSGKVETNQSQWVPYGGAKLKSNQRAYWKVKVYTTAGETEWSEMAYWGVGLLKETHWAGRWIGSVGKLPGDDPDNNWICARYLRKEFSISKPVKQATLYIAGLGLYELYINGQQMGYHVGDKQILAPSGTDYRKTVLYNTFDVTAHLNYDNAIGVALGNGHYYTTRPGSFIYSSEFVQFGFPKLRLDLVIEYSDGTKETVVSDLSWKITSDGPIRNNSEYDGEYYDARMELDGWTSVGYDDSSWMNVAYAANPIGTLRGAMAPNMKIKQEIKPKEIHKLGDKYIMDMGQNFSGWIRMKVRGEEGREIRLRFAETLQDNGEIYTDNFRGAKATDTYICNGDENGREWSPSFTFHGFRYVEISGYDDPQLSDFCGEVITDEMETIGTFESSNKVLNDIYHNCYWGILSNYKGFPVDCPQRDEREPWLGDRDMGVWGESYVFGNERLYSKWARDLRESQREDGCIPDVAPAFWVTYSDNVTWPFAFPSVVDMLYTRFGNTEPVEKSYPHIKYWLEHICEEYMDEGYIVRKDTYGDWCVPPESLDLIYSKDPARMTEGALLSTAYVVKSLQILQRFASILGLEDDVKEYEEFEKKVVAGFNAEYLHVEGDKAYYANNTVTANVLPLAFGICPKEYEDAVFDSMLNTIMVTYEGHVSCGVIGMQWLLKELSNRGRSDIAWHLATLTTYPSWGYMITQGATTVWELWNGDAADPLMNSGNHVMLIGDLVVWMYENVGGIRTDLTLGNSGYKHIIFAPDFNIEGSDYANVSYKSLYGKIVSNWKKGKKYIEWEISVPANTTAEVHLPDGTVEQIGSGDYYYKINR